tara:strand:+ start:305 stop:1132 length:828 start_codon:yes stop_codon:yes gene_type:complete
MKRLILLLLFISCNADTPIDWVYSLPNPWTLSNDEVTELLPEFHKRFPEFNDRLKAINIWRIGTPYGIFKLGEEREPDTDPILRIDTSDCTVHVLTSLAFSTSFSWSETRKNMVDIHYKPDINNRKIPTYKSRWHYTSDRIKNNPYTIDITESIIQKENMDSVNIILNKKADGSQFLDLSWSSENKIYFIPVNQINQSILSKLPDVCGAAFVRKSYFKNGIVIAHEGVLIDNKELIHASSKQLKTVKVDFLDYINNNGDSKFDGIMFYKFHSLSR